MYTSIAGTTKRVRVTKKDTCGGAGYSIIGTEAECKKAAAAENLVYGETRDSGGVPGCVIDVSSDHVVFTHLSEYAEYEYKCDADSICLCKKGIPAVLTYT